MGPQKTEKSGCLDVASSSSLNLWILVEKKSPTYLGDRQWGWSLGGAVHLLARQLICDVEENFARRTALELVAHVVLLCLQEEFLHLLAVVDEDLSAHRKS